MDLTLTDEQHMLAESARHFAEQVCPSDVVRQVEASDSGFSSQLWSKLCELGYPGLVLPEKYGGSGGTILDLAIVAEELGRVAFPSPLLTSVALGALPIMWSRNDWLADRYLSGLTKGELIATMALVEPGGGNEWSEIGAAGKRLTTNWRLSGNKILVPYAANADLILVAANLEGSGLSLIALERTTPGIKCERHRALGGDPLYSLSFDRVTFTPASVLGPDLDARAVLNRALDHAAVLQSAYAVGLSERALSLAVAHASTREQFGRPIGSFQAVAHRCSDMRIDIDACRFLALQAAWRLDQPGSADLDVAAAKAYINDAVRRVFTNAHQVHGAIGYSTEYDLQLFTRRAKAFELSLGSTALHHERVAKELGL
ncbi:MAG TPA: acyl-CoA dehydrogenase family protein [Candidatus Binataceae bacterium]|jgi:alkylation response protein AidB-like acyl-CoA dehydrogenase|nr:acyl-CoA dehydrogenase family protein [Candidatus Binataceae bacterium]